MHWTEGQNRRIKKKLIWRLLLAAVAGIAAGFWFQNAGAGLTVASVVGLLSTYNLD